MSLVIIPCIHIADKTQIRVNYDGTEKILNACDSCIEVIKSSTICKILEVLN